MYKCHQLCKRDSSSAKKKINKKSATLNESLTDATWLHLNSTPAHHTCGKCKAYNGTTKSVFNQDLGAQGTPWKIFIMHQEKR